ncbi:hypothetical protein VTK56DRAFT_9139 [Thermocarpiscus australiensis]
MGHNSATTTTTVLREAGCPKGTPECLLSKLSGFEFINLSKDTNGVAFNQAAAGQADQCLGDTRHQAATGTALSYKNHSCQAASVDVHILTVWRSG